MFQRGLPVCKEGNVLIIQLICLVVVSDGIVEVFGFVGSIALFLLLQCLLFALRFSLSLALFLSFRFWLGRLGLLSRLGRLDLLC